jgi:spore coat protein CotH
MNRFTLFNTIKAMALSSLLINVLLLSGCGGSSASEVSIEPTPAPVVENTNLNQFSFLKVNNPDLTSDIYLDINDNYVTGRTKSNIEVDNLIASFTHNGAELSVGDEIQSNGLTGNDFTDVITYTVKTADGSQENYQVDLTKFTGLPIVYLSTDNNVPIDSKEDYVEGSVSLDGGRYIDDLQQTPMKIRGRGNSTWFTHPKKPFQMKFSDKTEFLGMPADKKWLFLAEYSDKTMLRNKIAFEMGYISQLEWTPQSTFAEVYISGEYNGTYNITQKVEESGNRADLGDTGYLLEIDQLERLDEDDVYFYTDKFLINIKEPSIDLGSTEYLYIEDLINEFETVLLSDEFNDPISGYAKFIDVDSFIDWYLISEITKNVDSQFFSSIYLNVMPGEKIKMGPLWDFDLSFGNVDYADSQFSAGFWILYHPWYSRLFQDPEFVNKVNERFKYFKTNEQYILNKIDQQADALKWAQQENDDKWETIGSYVWPNSVVLASYDEEVIHLKSWYTKRMNWLKTALISLK